MIVFYLIAAIAAGSEFVSTLSGDMSPTVCCYERYELCRSVTIVYSGVRMILGDLIPSFSKVLLQNYPNAIPAVDCAVFFTYAQRL